MQHLFHLLLFSMVLVACRSTEKGVAGQTVQPEAVAQRYQLLIKFSTLEDVKRVPYRFQHLKMELMDEVSATEHIHRVAVSCKEYEIDGTVGKLNQESGIEWAERAD